IDDAAGHEEWRHPARAPLLQQHPGTGDTVGTTDPGADQNTACGLVLVGFRLPAGIVERLPGGAHRVHDELVDLALLLRLHPLIWIVGAARTITARDLAGNAGRQVGHVDALDAAHAALAGEQAPPGMLDTAAERRHHAEACDDDPSHVRFAPAHRQRFWFK